MDQKLIDFKVVSENDESIFWNKLTSENRWSIDYAKEVFNEYKRFIWLTKISNRRIVPSKCIDRVWHLHMTFTRSYWQDLCHGILDNELHHYPEQSCKCDYQAYCNTLQLYELEFGEKPAKRYWPRTNQTVSPSIQVAFFSLFAAALITACSAPQDGDWIGYLKWAVFIYLVYKVIKWLSTGTKGGGGNCGGACGSGCGGGD